MVFLFNILVIKYLLTNSIRGNKIKMLHDTKNDISIADIMNIHHDRSELHFVVPNVYLYAPNHPYMGKHNKVTKLTGKIIRYIIRAKIRNESTKSIVASMKLSESTVKRVWMHWINHKEPVPIKKPGRKKKETDAESEQLIITVYEKQRVILRKFGSKVLFPDTRGCYVGKISRWV